MFHCDIWLPEGNHLKVMFNIPKTPKTSGSCQNGCCFLKPTDAPLPSHFMVILHLRFTTQQPFIVILFIAPTVILWCSLHVFWRLGQAQNSPFYGVFQVQKHAKTNGFWCPFQMFEQKPINLHHWRSWPACFCSYFHSVCHPFVRVGW